MIFELLLRYSVVPLSRVFLRNLNSETCSQRWFQRKKLIYFGDLNHKYGLNKNIFHFKKIQLKKSVICFWTIFCQTNMYMLSSLVPIHCNWCWGQIGFPLNNCCYFPHFFWCIPYKLIQFWNMNWESWFIDQNQTQIFWKKKKRIFSVFLQWIMILHVLTNPEQLKIPKTVDLFKSYGLLKILTFNAQNMSASNWFPVVISGKWYHKKFLMLHFVVDLIPIDMEHLEI